MKTRNQSWIAVGWLCVCCGNMVLDDAVKMSIDNRRKEIEMVLAKFGIYSARNTY
jgi:putative ubiquitin-RnfH superfamily antitoxin RatB of RatAB toxin-antitoxin module